jgi:hypothetical protein
MKLSNQFFLGNMGGTIIMLAVICQLDWSRQKGQLVLRNMDFWESHNNLIILN